MADSLDSGSSVLYGRAGSSPASRTKSHRKKFRWVPLRGVNYIYARVVELVDSLDSGSSVHYAREGSSPSSRTSSSQASYRLRRFFMLRVKSSSCAHSAAPRFRAGFASLDSGSGERGKYPEWSRLAMKNPETTMVSRFFAFRQPNFPR